MVGEVLITPDDVTLAGTSWTGDFEALGTRIEVSICSACIW